MKCQGFQCDPISPNKSGGAGGKEERKGEREREKKEKKKKRKRALPHDQLTGQENWYLKSVQSLSPVWLFATPWTAARQASLSISNSQSLLKLMPIESVMPSNHLILCPLLLLPSLFPSIRVFSIESVLSIRWPKSWSFWRPLMYPWLWPWQPFQGCSFPLSEKELNPFYDSLQLSHSKNVFDFF